RRAPPRAWNRERRRPRIPDRPDRARGRTAAPAAGALGSVGGERAAGDQALRVRLPVELGLGPGGRGVWSRTAHLWNPRVLLPGAGHGGAVGAWRRDFSHRTRPAVAPPTGGLPGRAVGRHSIRGLRTVGDLRLDPVPAVVGRARSQGYAPLDAIRPG